MYMTLLSFSLLLFDSFVQYQTILSFMVPVSGYLPSSPYIGILWENLDTPKMNLQILVCTFSRISTFSYPHTSQSYNKIGSTHMSNNLSITSVGRFSLLPFCMSEYIAFEALSCSNSLALTKDPFQLKQIPR